MKKIYLSFIILLIAVIGYSQPALLLKVTNATTAIGQKVPKGAFIYDLGTGFLWNMDSAYTGTKTLTTIVGKTLKGGYLAGAGINISGNSITNTSLGAATYSAGIALSLSGTTFSGNYVGGTGITISTNTITVKYDSIVNIVLGKTFWKNTVYLSNEAAVAGSGKVTATNTTGDTVDYCYFTFKKSGRITMLMSSANFDTLGTASKLIMNDTSGWKWYIKNNKGVYRKFTIEYSYFK